MEKRITIRLDDETADAIEAVSQKYRLSKSEVIRMMILDKMPNDNLSADDYARQMQMLLDIKTALARLNTEFVKIGTNINQIAKIANQTRSINPKHIDFINKLSMYLDKLIVSVDKLSATVNFDMVRSTKKTKK